MTRIMRFALVCAVLWFTPQAQAQGATYLNEAVQALQSGDVYVSVQASDINDSTKQQLAQQAAANDVAVVALPSAAASEVGNDPAAFARTIALRSGDNTVVLSVGGKLAAVSRDLPSGTAATLAAQAQSDSGSTGEALLNFIGEVREARSQSSARQSVTTSDGGSGLLFAGLVVLVALAAGGFGLFRFSRRRASGQLPEHTRAPGEVRELLSEVQRLGRGIAYPGMQDSLSAGKRHTEQLFARLVQSNSNQIQQTTATYVGHLQRVRQIVLKFQDIEDHPEYYSNADTLLLNGLKTVQHYEAGVLQNTREVTSGSLTDFKVNTKLLSAMNTTDDPTL